MKIFLLLNKIKQLPFIRNKSIRNKRIIYNSTSNAAARFTNILVNLIVVPVTLNYLGTERYGLWMTITGVLGMVSFADLGVGSGVLNSVSTAYGFSDYNKIKKTISNAFILLCSISSLFVIISLTSYFFVPWDKLFNIKSPEAISEAAPTALVLLLSFAINFPLGTIQKTLIGLQEAYIDNLFQIIGKILSLLFLLVAIFLKANLVYLVMLYTAGNIIPYLLGGYYLFSNYEKDLKPSILLWDFKEIIKLLKNGSMFLLIQIAGILAYSADNVIIANKLNLEMVTIFSVVNRLFSFPPQIQTFLVASLWPAYGEAKAKDDWNWIRMTFKKSLYYSFLIILLFMLPFYFFGNQIISIWVRKDLMISNFLLLTMVVWTVLRAYGGSIASLLNGLNELKVQVYFAVLFGVSSVVLKLLFVPKFGLEGLMVITIVTWTVFTLIPSFFIVQRILKKDKSNDA